MSVGRTGAIIAVAALLGAVAGGAHAADKGKRIDFTVKSEPSAAPGAGRLMQYDASKGRFGLTLGVKQSDERETTANDVQAGAYFRITPSLRVGGSVALGEQELAPRPNQARPADAPKVRLESSFKF
ncbi:NtrZ family periplasmic regulatory protein [Phenylobacterium sp. VNQ135]|uniref:NtrZ family periplasmic regulatory protein n=1 Tax=Phenylobacterium sp. VNQ135 TaxID=3400922 RepID=UPI003C060249